MVEANRLDVALLSVLPGDSLFAVGGRVRDEIRSVLDGRPRPAKDFDYVVVGLTLDTLIERLRRIGTADVVGAAFAVVKATIDGTTVDVALPRRERSTGVGHREFTVESGPAVPLEDDLARRDFRMNMIARSVATGNLVDPFGGQADIRAQRIDVLGPNVFADDPLRMLRACQFAARLGYAVTATALAAMREAAPLVASVSPERIRDELIKLLGAPRPSVGIELMRESGLLAYVLPEVAEGIGVTQNVYHAFDVYHHALATLDATPIGDLTLRFAALLHDVAKPRTKTTEDGEEFAHFYRHDVVGEGMAREILLRLRLSTESVENVARLVRHHMYAADPMLEEKTLRRFVRRIGAELLAQQFELRAADIVGSGLPKRDDANERYEERVWTIVRQEPPLSVGDLAVSGTDVLAALQRASGSAVRGGPEVGRILRGLLERVIDDPALNERDALLSLLESSAPTLALESFHGKHNGETE
ncbi:MAG: HD domain-containing protein [Candidatus Eremiobacteraeota bacterium]|nr:HD domain-containing protein [Candidatus Eremiobacteraeota bacterium]